MLFRITYIWGVKKMNMSFTNPEILYALPAVLIPLVIHLFNFRRYKKFYFSNISLLKDISIETKRQSRVKHLIVMLLRMLAIIALIIAFAGPRFGKEQGELNNDKIVNAIYIDNSFSMQAGDLNGRVFDRAVLLARKLVKNSSKDAVFVVQDNDKKNGLRKLNKDEALSFIDNAKINLMPAGIPSVMDEFSRFASLNKDYLLKAYLFSDFQKSAFLADQVHADSIAEWNLINLFNQETANVFIDTCFIKSPVLLPNTIEKVFVGIKNASANNIHGLGIKLFIDGENKSISNVDLEANDEKVVEMQFNTAGGGWKNARLEIEDYPITFDNTMYFTFKVSNKINVLAINPQQENKYLKAFYNSDSIFNFSQTDYKSIDYQNLNTNKLIIVNGLDDISSGLTNKLKDYADQGGNLMLIPPADDNIESFNNMLAKLKMGKISGPFVAETRVKGIKLVNSIFENAIAEIPENADLPVIFKQFAYDDDFKSKTESLLSLLNGDDLLLKKNKGNGIVYLLNISLDDSFSNFARHQLFIPMMYGAAIEGESVSSLYEIVGRPSEAEVVINQEALNANDDNVFSLKSINSDFSFIPYQEKSGNKIYLSFDKLPEEAGVFSLQINNGENESSGLPRIAFNYNRNESLMVFYSAASVVKLLKKAGVANFRLMEFRDASTNEVINSGQKESRQWRVFIIFALLFLMVEILILRFWP